jgi:hypothetical protein
MNNASPKGGTCRRWLWFVLPQRPTKRRVSLFTPLALSSRQAIYNRESNSAALLDYDIVVANFLVHRFAASVQPCCSRPYGAGEIA